MTQLDPAYCADGCGRLAETERVIGMWPAGDLIDGEEVHSYELVCNRCAHTDNLGES